MRMIVRKRVASAAVAVAISVLAYPSQVSAQGLMVTGYADFEASVNNVGSDDGSEVLFDNHHFNVIVLGNVIGDLFVAAEVEYEHAGDEIGLEYGFLTYSGIDNMRISAGKFLVPFGRFNKDLHPTWINKMADRPNGFTDILPAGYSDVGIWLSGGIPLDDAASVSWDVFMVNGLLGEDGGNIRDMRGNVEEAQVDGVDNNKAVGGRLGLVLLDQNLDFGGSIYTGNYSDMSDVNLTLTLFGFDAHYKYERLDLRGEFVSADQQATVEDLTKKGGYVQAAYNVYGKWEPVVRYSMRDMPGEDADQSRFSLGLNYNISPAATVRLDYHINSEESGFESDNNEIILQFTTGF